MYTPDNLDYSQYAKMNIIGIDDKGSMIQKCSCQRCGLAWNSIYRLDDYELSLTVPEMVEG